MRHITVQKTNGCSCQKDTQMRKYSKGFADGRKLEFMIIINYHMRYEVAGIGEVT